MTKPAHGPATPPDADLDAAKADLEHLKGQLAHPTVGAPGGPTGATGFDPAVITAIIDTVLKLIEWLRKRNP